MSWTSQTGQFGKDELGAIEAWTAPQIARTVANADPVVVLRILAEILLNEDTAKLDALLAMSAINAKWRAYETDTGVDARDH